MSNPLLKIDVLPAFSMVKPEHINPAITELMEKCKETIDRVVSENLEDQTWDSLVAPLEEVLDRLSISWGIVSHLNSVMSNDDLRKEHDLLLPKISDFYTWIGQHEGLYNAYKNLSESDGFSLLSLAQQKSVEEELKGFKLSGIGLSDDKKKEFAEISCRESELSSLFSNNVLDATNAFVKQVIDVNELDGLPETALALAKQEAESRGLEGYVFTLKLPSYLPVLKYANNSKLRYEMYYAYVTRASEIGPDANKFDNAKIIDEELALSLKAAHILGYKNAAELSLVKKMAESTDQVVSFLNDLVDRSKSQAKAEVEEIYKYAKSKGCNQVNAWDLTYYSEQLLKEKYEINDELIKPYFPLPKVINGLFKLVKLIFGIEVRPHFGVDVWHSDVSFYDIIDNDGVLRGSFYMDLYARDKKNGGAWMDSCMGRRYRSDGTLQKPIAYIVCNFTPPLGDKPSLLTHDDVETLFHEFGHGLHHMLTTVDVSEVAGINNVPWDAVELPSQFMENFTWQPEVLAFISSHVDTDEPLPKELLEKLLSSKNYNSALAMLRQLEFALFDFHVYMDYGSYKSVAEVMNKTREQVSVLPIVEFNRFQNSFTHIFAGGYSAGYYSYKWAEVLSADVFSRFEEEGILNPKVGSDYLNCILQNGGSKDFMKMFIDFRGRRPKIDAILRHSGIK
jgi:oligopeptidase A